MANKQDVFNAFYEGVCAVLVSDHLRGLAGNLEIDLTEFGRWLDEHPEYEELRIYADD